VNGKDLIRVKFNPKIVKTCRNRECDTSESAKDTTQDGIRKAYGSGWIHIADGEVGYAHKDTAGRGLGELPQRL
jgi:hypothetical protein